MMTKYNKEALHEHFTGQYFCRSSFQSYLYLIKDTVFLIPIFILSTKIFGFSKTPENVWGCYNTVKIWGILTNMTGLAGFCKMGWFISSWWYLKVAILFIVMFPLLFYFIKKCGSLCLVVFAIIAIPYMFSIDMNDTVAVWRYIPAFLFGMVMAEEKIVEMIRKYANTVWKEALGFVLLCIFLVLFVFLRHQFGSMYLIQSVQAWLIALIIAIYIGNIPFISEVLKVLGNNSKYIWLIHVYIYGQVMTEWLFSLRNIWLILGVLLIVSLILSIALKRIANLLYAGLEKCIYRKHGEHKNII